MKFHKALGWALLKAELVIPKQLGWLIALPVAIDVQAADAATAGNRTFPDTGVYRAAPPLNVAWTTYVHR